MYMQTFPDIFASFRTEFMHKQNTNNNILDKYWDDADGKKVSLGMIELRS